jgi:hypothetical protein
VSRRRFNYLKKIVICLPNKKIYVMRKVILFLMLFFISSRCLAQESVCESTYMPFKNGISFELTTYDKKGKETSVVRHKVSSIAPLASGFKATVETETFDAKGESLLKGVYYMECRDGVMYMDMNSLLDPRTLQGVSGMEVEVSGDALSFPARLNPGETLPDGTLTMKAGTGGLTIMNLNMTVSNRKIEAFESVTTPAGTFECVKISQDSELKAIIKKSFKSTGWYAKGVGTVRSENYDSKGNLESYTLLTKLEK